MNILLVFCHPLKSSFIGSLYADIVNQLRADQHTLELCDLYDIGFAPALSGDDLRAYADPPPQGTTRATFTDSLQSAEGLILIFPTWWYSMPAMLKGYFERIWTPGVAFELADGDSMGTLKNIRRYLVVTTYGASQSFIEDEVGDACRLLCMNGVRRLLAKDCKSAWRALYGVDKASEDARENFRHSVIDSLRLFQD